MNFAEEESKRKRNKGMEQLNLEVAKADNWNQDLVHILFPDSQKPNSASVANAVGVLTTARLNFTPTAHWSHGHLAWSLLRLI